MLRLYLRCLRILRHDVNQTTIRRRRSCPFTEPCLASYTTELSSVKEERFLRLPFCPPITGDCHAHVTHLMESIWSSCTCFLVYYSLLHTTLATLVSLVPLVLAPLSSCFSLPLLAKGVIASTCWIPLPNDLSCAGVYSKCSMRTSLELTYLRLKVSNIPPSDWIRYRRRCPPARTCMSHAVFKLNCWEAERLIWDRPW